MNGTGLKGAVDAALQKRRKITLEDWLLAKTPAAKPGMLVALLMQDAGFYVSEKSIRKWIADLPVSQPTGE